MFRILVSDPLAEAGVETLRREAAVDVRTGLPPDELRRILPEYDALIVRRETSVTAELLAAAPTLRVVTRAGVGTDNIDVPAATERGIVVLNTPGPNAITAAEHTLGLLLALLRHIPRADGSLKAGRWERRQFVGRELYHKTLGILGLGRIGREVAHRARAFGMEVLAYDPYVAPAVAESIGAHALPLEEVLARADVLLTPHLAASSVEAQLGVALAAAESTLAALKGELVENAVNLPGLTPGALAALRPWLDLADQLGRLVAHTLDGPATGLEVGFLGAVPGGDPNLIIAAAIRGFLRSAIPEQVTFINARLLAERRGLAVSERFAHGAHGAHDGAGNRDPDGLTLGVGATP